MDNGASSYRRYLEGDEEAFAHVVNAYFQRLMMFAARYVRDTGVAEDIAIEVFSDLIAYRHRYDFRWPLWSYLCMVARSRALNYIKHNRVLEMLPLSEAGEREDPGQGPEERMLQTEQTRALHGAIAKLPPDQREAVQLVYFSELSCEDAGRVMRKTRKQIYNLLYRAKNTLRTELGEDGVANAIK